MIHMLTDVSSQHLNRDRPTIGFLTAWLRDPYVTAAWSGVIEAARERDVNVVQVVGARLRSPLEFEAPAQVLFDLVDPNGFAGLVVFSEMLYHFVSLQELEQFLDRFRAVPMTGIGVVASIPSVTLDLKEGMRQMLSHLIEEHGYRRLAYLAGPAGEPTAEAYYRGYLEALAEFDIPFDPRLVTPPLHSWGAAIGTEGIRTLLDERRLRPAVDLDCIVGCGDLEGLAAIEALRVRGIRVPHDVAVTGFNDLEPARLATPSLTTIDRKIQRLARRATEMLLDRLDGNQVPSLEIVPPGLVVRRSCGCVPQMVIQATALPSATTAHGTDDLKLAVRRETILTEIERAVPAGLEGAVSGLAPNWPSQLLDAFVAELESEQHGLFFTTLEEILRHVLTADRNIILWQAVLSTMRRVMRPHLADVGVLNRAEDLWQQGRVLISDFAERAQGRWRLDAAQEVQTLSHITRSLITALDINGLMDVLARELPLLGIPGGFLSLYEEPSKPDGMARLLLAFSEQGRASLEPEGRRFPARQLIPGGFVSSAQRYDFVVLPLFFHDEQLGIVVLERGPRDGAVYEALQIQISSAVKGTLLSKRNIELYEEALAGRQAAEEADRLKSRFLSMVSHELRTPLSLIVGTIEMLLHEEPTALTAFTDSYRRDLTSIRTSAQHLARLIGDVLDLASSQAGQLRVKCEPLDLAELLAKVAVLGEPMARERGLTWQTDIPATLPRVSGDRTRLQQVILNLVGNAVKFTEQGTVTLWAEAGRNDVMLAVSDTGMGISLAEQETIFDEFRQSERSTRRGYGGMGLGLAISRRLVELHGGQIGVLSSGADGAGSTFYFTLPIVAASLEETQTPGDRGHSVLLLTEKAVAGERLRAHLVDRGFDVELLTLEDRPNWLGQVVVSPPGAVVLDFEPAAERGWEIMQLLRQNQRTQDIPIIFYSLEVDEARGTALELDYLVKPTNMTELARALARQGLYPEQRAGDWTILVVDDEPGILDLHSRMLQGLTPQYRILKARDGRKALEMMARRRPDLVLLDLMMPVMDGFAVLEAMRENALTRDVPVIVLTAQLLTEPDMARLQSGVAAVLSKGLFSSDEVLAQVESALGRGKRLRGEMRQMMRKVMAHIHQHYAEPITRESLARAVGLSERYLTLCFRAETGLTPVTYLNRYRIKQSRTLLERGDLSITEVALAVGFSDSNYFAHVFRDQVGVSPRAYQRGERVQPVG